MKLKYSFLDNMTAMQALDKLSRVTNLDAKVAYRIGKLAARVNKEMEICRKEAVALLTKYAVCDEKQLPVNFPQGPFKFEGDNEKLHDEAFTALMETEFEENVFPVKLSEVSNCGLSPQEIIALKEHGALEVEEGL